MVGGRLSTCGFWVWIGWRLDFLRRVLWLILADYTLSYCSLVRSDFHIPPANVCLGSFFTSSEFVGVLTKMSSAYLVGIILATMKIA